MEEKSELVIITGMSGAGKTVAMQCFEDLGYFCIDNMPPQLFPKFWELMMETGNINKIAMVVDLRSRSFFQDAHQMIIDMKEDPSVHLEVLFLDADDQELVSRYKETRRSHPMSQEGRTLEGIKKERELLSSLRSMAHVIDTTNLSSRQLQKEILKRFSTTHEQPFHISVMSFGFKNGIPIDADIVMDVRFLPNPYYIDKLRPKTGQDPEVYDYVMSFKETESFYQSFKQLLEIVIPGYKQEGKKGVTIAIGCTGGKHRSVALTERVGHSLRDKGYKVNISHRDKGKE